MDKISLINVIGKIAVFISLIFALFLFTVKTKNRLGNRLFASFIIFCAIDISGLFINKYLANYPNIVLFRSTIAFLIIPSFYLYVLSICYTNFQLKLKHLIHTLPFFISNLILVPHFYLANDNEKYFFLRNLNQMPETMISNTLLKVQAVFYIISIFIILKKYKDIYLENYTNTGSLTYKWLFQLAVISSITFFISLLKTFFKYTENGNIYIWANIVLGTMALCMMCWFVLKAMYYPYFFRGIDSKLHPIKDEVHTTEVNNKTDQYNHEQVKLLRKYMIDQEPYVDPSLTIQELSNMINIPVRDLSLLINHHIGQHFFHFVNEYRIQKAKEILRDPAKKDLTILEILYDVGFNSKSSFNTAFKKFTNLTPTEYRNNSQ